MDIRTSESENEPVHKSGFWARLRSNFLTGVIFIAPIAVTLWFIWWAINFIDSRVEPFIPAQWRPINLIGYDIPGVGVIFFLIVATMIGWLTKGFVGRQLKIWLGSFVNQFPIVRTIYNALHQILETVFSNSERHFRNACLIEYPRKGIYAIGFVANDARGEILKKSGEPSLTAVFVPTTPNPTSGFLLYIPTKDVRILDMSVEDAAKMVISSGLVEPEQLQTPPDQN